MSPRVRRLAKENPKLRVVHRCFALAPTPGAIAALFGSAQRGKQEILNHWRAANRNDDEHRIDAERMAARPFPYPYSLPGLAACKAAEVQGGQEAHWDMFDRIQRAHLTECLDIADPGTLAACAREVGLDVVAWERDWRAAEVRRAVEQDLGRARDLRVTAVPTLLAGGGLRLVGARTTVELKGWIREVAAGATGASGRM
jgi:putative protein-disulfide isomerase